MTSTVRLVTGREAAKAARALQTLVERRDAWPFPHSYAPPNSQRVQVVQSIAAPVVGVQAVVAAYTVPLGFRFWLTDIVQLFTGSGFIPGRGDATWQLDKNSPVGIANLSALLIDGFAALDVTLGSLLFPWPLRMPELLEPNDVLRSKVTTTAAIAAGTPNYFTSMFLGWLVPAE
jgi:hypothetical protein